MTNEIQRYGAEISRSVWRLSRTRYKGFQIPPAYAQGEGRFDDPLLIESPELATFGVLYCAESEYASFVEVLAGLRNSLETWTDVSRQTIMDVEIRDSMVADSSTSASVVSRQWQNDWNLSSANLTAVAPVFDITSAAAVQFIREQLAITILALGHTDLDFSHVLGDNRDLTRAISRWIWSMKTDSGDPLFAGIRYRSRFDPQCNCLALYQDRFRVEGEVATQPVTPNTPGFSEATTTLRLHIR